MIGVNGDKDVLVDGDDVDVLVLECITHDDTADTTCTSVSM